MEFEFQPVDTIDAVPEPFRPLYAAMADGKFGVADTHKGAAEAIVGLNRSLKAARQDAKSKTPTDLSSLSEFGTTVDEINTAVRTRMTELQNQLAQGDTAKLNLDKIRQELADGHSKDLLKHTTRIEALQAQLYDRLVTSEAVSAIAEAKGIPELLMPFVRNQVKVAEANGKFDVYVVDQAGDQRYSGITGQPMTIRELVNELKANEKFGRLFESESGQGGGTPPRTPGQRPPAQPGATRSSTDKISAGLAAQQRK